MRVEYVGAAFDSSGYASASRGYLQALHLAGCDVSLRPVSFETKRPELGELGQFLQSLCHDDTPDATVRVFHSTPDNWPAFAHGRPQIPTAGYATWEADRLPPAWPDLINRHCQLLMVPSRQNIQAFKESGVTIPVHRIPHCFADVPVRDKRVLPESEDFRFLNIGQWLTRKNQMGLLIAYFTEFQADEKVSLVMKTFLTESTPAEKEQIKGFIAEIKRQLHLPAYPKVELIVGTMPDDAVQRLYHDTDCYVSLHRQEGFGMTIAEAMLAGKPVIATDYGGPSDFARHGGWAISVMVTPVFGMPWGTYTGAMTWAEPNLMHARKVMREFSARPEHVASIAKHGRAHILGDLSFARVGEQMRDLLAKMVAT